MVMCLGMGRRIIGEGGVQWVKTSNPQNPVTKIQKPTQIKYMDAQGQKHLPLIITLLVFFFLLAPTWAQVPSSINMTTKTSMMSGRDYGNVGDSSIGMAAGASNVTDGRGSSGGSISGMRDALREELRKKLINSLTQAHDPQPITIASAASVTGSSATVLTVPPNNANMNINNNNGASTVIVSGGMSNNNGQLQGGAGSGVVSEASALAKREVDIINQVKIETQKNSQDIKIQNIFSRLPRPQQLDDLIMTTDSFALIKTIQTVSESNLTCEQKISYLSDFFGRIEAAVNMKNFTLAKLMVVIEGAKTEVRRLNQQIQRNNQSINALGLDQLKIKLNDGLDQLSVAYNNFNRVDSTVDPKRAAIAKSQAIIDDLKRKIQSNKQEMPGQKLHLLEINKNIAMLEQQLSDAKAKKGITEAYIANLEQNTKLNQEKIKEEKKSLDLMEAELNRIYSEYDRTKSRYKVLEVQVQRLRTQIAQKQKRQTQFMNYIQDIQARVNAQTRKIDTGLQSKLQSLIKDLQNLVPSIQNKIDEINFRCNQVKQIETITLRSGQITLFLLTPRDFNSYMLSSYDIKQDLPNLKPIKVSLSSTSILDRAWVQAYGNPYSSEGYYETNSFVFKGDFTCLAPSELETGSGTVVNINRKFIEIIDQGVRSKLNLGACTRIEAVQSVPQIGQKLYFRGKKLSQGEYNVYKASCF